MFDVIGFKNDDIGSKALLDFLETGNWFHGNIFKRHMDCYAVKLLVFLSLTNEAQETHKEAMKAWIDAQVICKSLNQWSQNSRPCICYEHRGTSVRDFRRL